MAPELDIESFRATGTDAWTNSVMEIGPRFNPPRDASMRVSVAHLKLGNPISVVLDVDGVRALHEYLDMENAGNFVLRDAEASLVVYQEDDGQTFIRTYRNPSGRSQLAYLSNEDTGRLYGWLGAALAGKWDGWKYAIPNGKGV